MFTGIIQSMAEIIDIEEKELFRTHVIRLPYSLLSGLEIGSSVAHNGCCLSVTRIEGDYVSFHLVNETIRITNLAELKIGDMVNIERAAKFSDEIGGHLMSGHIMTTAIICKIIQSENNHNIWFELQDKNQQKYILYKGYIGIDGVSLTVGEIIKGKFCVHLIPETLHCTTFGIKKLGQKVNIEIDSHSHVIVETVERVLSQLDITTLMRNVL